MSCVSISKVYQTPVENIEKHIHMPITVPEEGKLPTLMEIQHVPL